MSEAPTADQAPPAPVEVPTDSRQDAGQGKKVEAPQSKDNNQEKGKGKASDTAISQSKQVADPQAPKTKAWDIIFSIAFVFFVYCFCIFFFFVKDLYFVLIINEDTLLLFYMLWQIMVNSSAVISFISFFFTWVIRMAILGK